MLSYKYLLQNAVVLGQLWSVPAPWLALATIDVAWLMEVAVTFYQCYDCQQQAQKSCF